AQRHAATHAEVLRGLRCEELERLRQRGALGNRAQTTHELARLRDRIVHELGCLARVARVARTLLPEPLLEIFEQQLYAREHLGEPVVNLSPDPVAFALAEHGELALELGAIRHISYAHDDLV